MVLKKPSTQQIESWLFPFTSMESTSLEQEISRYSSSFDTIVNVSGIQDVGVGKGKQYALNFPLRDGIDDLSYQVSVSRGFVYRTLPFRTFSVL